MDIRKKSSSVRQTAGNVVICFGIVYGEFYFEGSFYNEGVAENEKNLSMDADYGIDVRYAFSCR